MSYPSVFPGALDTFPTNRTAKQVIGSSDVNGAFDAINKMEDYLLTAEVLNIRRFGGVHLGLTDTTQALRDAYAALLTLNGGTIYFGPGDWLFDNATFAAALALSPDNANTRGWTRILLDPRARIILSTRTPRFVDFGKVADHDWFRKFVLEGGVIDAGSAGGKHHVVIGTYQNNVTQSRINLDRILIRRGEVVNVPVDPTVVTHRLNVWFSVSQAAAGEGTQNTLTDIAVEDYRFNGGHQGVFVGGSGISTTGLNVLCDRIRYDRLWHSLLSCNNLQFASSGFQIGSRAQVGSFAMRNCQSYYSGDVGFEVNSFDEGLIENCWAEDANNAGFYLTNFNNPPNPTSQHLLYRKCHARRKLITNAASNGIGYYPDVQLAVGLGHIEYDDCTYLSNSVGKTNQGQALHQATPVPMRSLRLRNFASEISGWTTAPGAGIGLVAVYVNPSGVTPVIIEDLHSKIAGTVTPGSAGTVTARDLYLVGNDIDLDLDGLYTDFNVSADVGHIQHYGIDEQTGCGLRGRIKRLVPVAETGDPAGTRGMVVRGLATLTITGQLLVAECDFSRLASGATELLFATAGENADKVLFQKIVRKNGGALTGWVNKTPGTSPWVYQNLSGYRQTVTVSGGTVSLIRRGRGGSYKSIGAAVSGEFTLQPADQIEITYTVAPTVDALDHF
jgi:hypothetical protein